MYRILSFDGGGIRGILSAMWLRELEDQLGGRVRDYCDLIIGTSTGAILAGAAALGIPAHNIVMLYAKRGRDVFPAFWGRFFDRLGRLPTHGLSAPKYSLAGLKRVLGEEIGDHDLRECKPTLIAVSYNTLSRRPFFFKSDNSHHGLLKVADAMMASAAAPTYFPAHVVEMDGIHVPLIDGGVVANNPSVCGVAEAISRGIKMGDIALGSFGTGRLTKPIDVKEATNMGALEWATKIHDVLLSGPTEASYFESKKLIDENRYVRLQTHITRANEAMDNADESNINALMNLGREYIGNGGLQKLTALANLLRG